ncbi:sensor histidine kinase [Agromyces italicus]|uniref:sensor histidine kinase n=1 Tax=Agromyces italicus TaxID=279572 RepID=UPI0003B314C3|nr:HAMP domain-containing sensor histidine kinase [Agromyces italicus]
MGLSSVRTRILVSIIGVAFVGLVFAGGAAYLVQRDRIAHAVDDRLLQRVESARAVVGDDRPDSGDAVGSAEAAVTHGGGYATTRDALRGVLERIVPGEHEGALGLVDGRVAFVPGVASEIHLESVPGFAERAAAETVEGDAVQLGTFVDSGVWLRYMTAPLAAPGDPQRGVYVVALDLDAAHADLDAAFTSYAVIAAGAVIATGLVGWFVAGRLLQPVRRLSSAASRITVNALDERIPVHGRDEVSRLTETVNGMFDRLDRSITSQRRLLDDVRHELKTPITIVRGHLELLDPADAEEVRATRELAIDELDRMAELVDRIELLAELPDDAPAVEPVDVAALTREVHAKSSVIAGHDWVLAATADVVVDLDPRRITQAWLQLVDNAAKYSPEGTPVRIGSSRAEGAVQLWVEDEGPGIPPGAEARIFERFGRVNTGRGIRGSGLGLPLVEGIALAHGGRVEVSSSSVGSRFVIILPNDRGDRADGGDGA